jgi:hypothetical protein
MRWVLIMVGATLVLMSVIVGTGAVGGFVTVDLDRMTDITSTDDDAALLGFTETSVVIQTPARTTVATIRNNDAEPVTVDAAVTASPPGIDLFLDGDSRVLAPGERISVRAACTVPPDGAQGSAEYTIDAESAGALVRVTDVSFDGTLVYDCPGAPVGPPGDLPPGPPSLVGFDDTDGDLQYDPSERIIEVRGAYDDPSVNLVVVDRGYAVGQPLTIRAESITLIGTTLEPSSVTLRAAESVRLADSSIRTTAAAGLQVRTETLILENTTITGTEQLEADSIIDDR